MLKPDSIPDFISAEKYVLGRLEENLSPLLFIMILGIPVMCWKRQCL